MTLYPRSTPLIWYLSTGFSWKVNSDSVLCLILKFLGGSLGAVEFTQALSKDENRNIKKLSGIESLSGFIKLLMNNVHKNKKFVH